MTECVDVIFFLLLFTYSTDLVSYLFIYSVYENAEKFGWNAFVCDFGGQSLRVNGVRCAINHNERNWMNVHVWIYLWFHQSSN